MGVALDAGSERVDELEEFVEIGAHVCLHLLGDVGVVDAVLLLPDVTLAALPVHSQPFPTARRHLGLALPPRQTRPLRVHRSRVEVIPQFYASGLQLGGPDGGICGFWFEGGGGEAGGLVGRGLLDLRGLALVLPHFSCKLVPESQFGSAPSPSLHIIHYVAVEKEQI